MKFFTTLSICFTALSLHAQSRSGHMLSYTKAPVDIQTFDVSCSGKSNGSLYARAEEPGWQLKMYKSDALIAEYFVAGADTFIAHLPEGNYSFVCVNNNQLSDTIHSRIAAPSAVISSAIISTTAPLVNETVTFLNTSSGAVAWHWDFGDGQTSEAHAPSHAYAQPGLYTVTLTAFNAAGCASTETYVINAMSPWFHSRAAAPVHENNTARTSASALQVRAHDGTATITSGADHQMVRVCVYTLDGQLIFSGAGHSVSFNYYSSALYMIQAEFSNGTVQSQQVFLN